MRKIPPGSEVANLFVGEVAELDKIIAAFVRLKVSLLPIYGTVIKLTSQIYKGIHCFIWSILLIRGKTTLTIAY